MSEASSIFQDELAVDPGFEAHAFDAFHVAWTRTVAKSVERVQNGFILRQFHDRQFAFEGRIGGCASALAAALWDKIVRESAARAPR